MRKLFCFLGMWASAYLLIGCNDSVVFNNNYDFEKNQWFDKVMPTFQFEIEDPNVAYNLSYNIRHSHNYPYYNLYLSRYLYDEAGKKMVDSKLNEDLILFDAKTGKPLGSGLGDMFDNKIAFAKNFKFPRKGKYTFKVRQQMRANPLTDVVSIGITIEKASK
jgi:gliding motility-associated lipoprotein GldH